jgi:hypothetical protein
MEIEVLHVLIGLGDLGEFGGSGNDDCCLLVIDAVVVPLGGSSFDRDADVPSRTLTSATTTKHAVQLELSRQGSRQQPVNRLAVHQSVRTLRC